MKPTAPPDTLRSPCISVCRMDEATGLCAGCFRTLDEIADWPDLTDDQRRNVWHRLRQRRADAVAALPASDGRARPSTTDAPIGSD